MNWQCKVIGCRSATQGNKFCCDERKSVNDRWLATPKCLCRLQAQVGYRPRECGLKDYEVKRKKATGYHTRDSGYSRYPWYRQLAGAPAGRTKAKKKKKKRSGLGPFPEQETKGNSAQRRWESWISLSSAEDRKKLFKWEFSLEVLLLCAVVGQCLLFARLRLDWPSQSDTSDSDLSQATSTRVGRDGCGRGKGLLRGGCMHPLHHIIMEQPIHSVSGCYIYRRCQSCAIPRGS